MNRIKSLDILRGMTVMLMITVNNPANWGHTFACLKHAAWNGFTMTDLVFPSFLFMVGASVFFAFRKYDHKLSSQALKKIITRGILIYVVGIALSLFPFYNFSTGEWFDPSKIRFMGVLQRIGIAYIIGSILVLNLKSTKNVLIAIGAILVGYIAIIYGLGDDTIEGYVGRTIDIAILGESHIYQGYGMPFDPEGLLSTIPSLATLMFGYVAAQLISKHKDILDGIKTLIAFGGILMLAGAAMNGIVPINKPIWSSSYVLYAGGISMMIWGLLAYWYDYRKHSCGTAIFEPFGTNALFIYVMSAVIVTLTYLPIFMIKSDGGEFNIFGWVYNSIQGCVTPNVASLIGALLLVLICWMIVYPLYRKKIFIKL